MRHSTGGGIDCFMDCSHCLTRCPVQRQVSRAKKNSAADIYLCKKLSIKRASGSLVLSVPALSRLSGLAFRPSISPWGRPRDRPCAHRRTGRVRRRLVHHLRSDGHCKGYVSATAATPISPRTPPNGMCFRPAHRRTCCPDRAPRLCFGVEFWRLMRSQFSTPIDTASNSSLS